MTHPTYLGLQIDWPLFVKNPFKSGRFTLQRGDHFKWQESNIDPAAVAQLYAQGYIGHDAEREITNNLGDRLLELTKGQMDTLVRLLNAEVKNRCVTKEEFNKSRCKGSSKLDRQRGLVKSFLRQNPWIEDDFKRIRDQILDGSTTEDS